MATLGFIGVGTMGAPMAERVLGAGHDLRVVDVAPGATDQLVAAGATNARTPAGAAAHADAVFLSLPGPDEVVAAVTGADGVLAAEPLPRYVVDLSTTSVTAGRELRARCEEHGVAFIDAPVSGGVAKARTGELAVLVGATPDEFAAVEPLLRPIGTTVVHVGPPGSGTVAKLVNNQLFLTAGVAVQEAYLLAGALGMSPDDAHAVISVSSAAPYAQLAPLLLGRRFDDVVFRLDIAAKDLALVLASAQDAGVDLPVTAAGAAVFADAVKSGHGEQVFHATLSELEHRAGVELAPLVRRREDRRGTNRG